VEELTSVFGEDVALAPCDVSSDEEISQFFDFVRSKTDRVDLLLHSVAFAPKEAMSEPFSQTSREAFRVAHDISAYSLIALSREVAP
jgi:enoyl-[acyl-carrier protein] reductase I